MLIQALFYIFCIMYYKKACIPRLIYIKCKVHGMLKIQNILFECDVKDDIHHYTSDHKKENLKLFVSLNVS